LRDVANIAAGALVFGQFLGDSAFSTALAVLGLAVWACLNRYAAHYENLVLVASVSAKAA
jgi:hypothetical protein